LETLGSCKGWIEITEEVHLAGKKADEFADSMHTGFSSKKMKLDESADGYRNHGIPNGYLSLPHDR
jgi:hypothetical protein